MAPDPPHPTNVTPGVVRRKRVQPDIQQLESYVLNLKESAQQSLEALRADVGCSTVNILHCPPAPEPHVSPSATNLQAQLELLKQENHELRNAVHLHSNNQTAHDALVQAHTNGVANGRSNGHRTNGASSEERSALQRVSALEQKCIQLQDALAESRRNSTATASTSAPSLDVNGSGAPGVSMTQSVGRSASVAVALANLQAQLQTLRTDKDHIEEMIVEMHETVLSDEIKKSTMALVRKKVSVLVAETQGAAKEASEGGAAKATPKMKARLDAANTQVETLQQELELKDSEVNAMQRHHHDLQKIAKMESEGQIAHLRDMWRAEQERRKELHHKVLELKGNIRVFCRIRPLMPLEAASAISTKDGESLIIRVNDNENLKSSDLGRVARANEFRRGSTPPSRNSRRSVQSEEDSSKNGFREFGYEFDRVFSPTDTQEMVFEDVSDLVTSVTDGYNVCIMAYGQTGSGKTHTMQGPPEDPGINTRALKELFRIGEHRKDDMAMELQASILEIYNDNIYDLLTDVPRESASSKLDIKEQGKHIWIPNLTMRKVMSHGDVEALITRGNSCRSTFATDMNEHSSRSHLILSLYVKCDNIITGQRTASKLHLIDLAGSERISRSHAAGDRLTEVKNINFSLSALGDCIQALQLHKEHIPYRNCKLTRILSDSLGGQSKTLLVTNLSPTKDSAAESRCSCEFAIRAKKIELGKALKQMDLSSPLASASGASIRGVSVGPQSRSNPSTRPRSANAAIPDNKTRPQLH